MSCLELLEWPINVNEINIKNCKVTPKRNVNKKQINKTKTKYNKYIYTHRHTHIRGLFFKIASGERTQGSKLELKGINLKKKLQMIIIPEA